MQLRLLPSLIVFIGSYLPLSLILLAQDARYDLLGRNFCWSFLEPNSSCALPFSNAEYSISIFLICLVCFCLSLFTMAVTKPDIPVDVIEAKYIPAELMSYTLPYVVSFMSIGYQETGKFVGFILFLVWMFWVMYKSGQLILNPVFSAFGWRYYEVTYSFPNDKRRHHGRALSHTTLDVGRHDYTSIQDILIFRPKK